MSYNASYSQTAKSQYKIASTIHVEGNGGWDLIAMDESTSRLFVSHGTMVQVIDVKQGTVVGTIPDTKGVHGIAIATDINKGFISCGKDTSVIVFDLTTLALIKRVRMTGFNPDAILYDSYSHNVFAFNAQSYNATVIDAHSNNVIGTIELPGKPELCVSDGHGKLYLNLEDKSMVCVINPSSLKVEQTWSLAPGTGPSGIAIDTKNHRLFIVCDNKLMVIMDAENGKVITTLPIGERVDGVVFDPDKKRAYSSNGEGTVTVVQEKDKKTFVVLETVTTQKGAKTITIDTKTHHLYLPTAEYGETPAPTKDNPKPRAAIKPGSFVVLDVELIK